FGGRRHAALPPGQRQRADLFGQRRAAWLARRADDVSARLQHLGQRTLEARLARALDALERDEAPAAHGAAGGEAASAASAATPASSRLISFHASVSDRMRR